MTTRNLIIFAAIAALAACGPSKGSGTGSDANGGSGSGSGSAIDAAPPIDAPPLPPGFGNTCTTASDCPSGLCVSNPTGGNTCTAQCTDTCPSGFACRVTEVNGAYQSVCLPPVVQVCTTCATDADCGGGECVAVGDSGAKYCLAVCGGEFGCGTGYTCTDNPDGNHTGASFCVPPSCDCRTDNAGQVRSCSNTNSNGTCQGTETCDPTAGGWGPCTAPTATPETCDGQDNNCNMLIDEGTDGVACDNTVAGVGTCSGITVCKGAGGVVCEARTPSAEKCNFVDDDCDGMVDEGFPNLGVVCNAGVGACERFGVDSCSSDGNSVVCSAVAGTPIAEKCNNVDDDCDGHVDEDFPTLGQQCTANVGTCARIGQIVCAASGVGTVCSAVAGSPSGEICDGLDNDCDGKVDEDFKGPTGVYDKDTACGNCSTDCTMIYDLPNAFGTCNATAAPVCALNCDASAYDLNGAVADGCEFILDPEAIYVSTSDPHSADDATCGLGPFGTEPGYHPCKTIAQGNARVVALSRLRVLVANGIYNEAVSVQNGKSLLGGYDWETWIRDVAATSTLITGSSSVGVHDRTVSAVNITAASTVEGFVIYGSVNNKTSGNSYAVYVSGSNASLSIINNIIFGGRGGPGGNGGIGGNGIGGSAGSGRNANLTVADAAYDSKVATGTGECNASNNRQYANGGTTSCGGVATNGGAGGGNTCPVNANCPAGDTTSSGCSAFAWASLASPRTTTSAPGSAGTMPAGGGAAGTGATQGDDSVQEYATLNGQSGFYCFLSGKTTYGLDGNNGGNGSHGSAVAGCSASSGTIIGSDWVGGGASGGVAGASGGGGGGGGAGGGGKCQVPANGQTKCASQNGNPATATDTIGAHGGGGGAGGCGGIGGGAATAGGGAFGIFIVGSGGAQPTVTGNQLFRGSGGNGGAGGAGGVGGTGGLGAVGGTTGAGTAIFCTDTAGRGGNGGDGGDGSGGGGGCGGSSFGIMTIGIGSPNYCTGTTNSISGGGGGQGGPGGYSVVNPGGTGTAGVLGTCQFL